MRSGVMLVADTKSLLDKMIERTTSLCPGSCAVKYWSRPVGASELGRWVGASRWGRR